MSSILKTRRHVDNFSDMYTRFFPGMDARTVTFIVTHECNLRCSYCYEHEKSSAHMSLEMAKQCVDTLFQEDERNSEYLNSVVMNGIILDFIGGEPFLEIELIGQIMEYFLDQAIAKNHRWATRYMISMTSNGMLYFDPKVQAFLTKYDGRTSVSITVDGDKQTHDTCRLDCSGCGSYDKAAAAFSHVKDHYRQDGTKFTIAPANVDRVYIACRDMIERFNVRTLHCNCVFEEGWNEELARVLYWQLKELADWVIDSGRYEELNLYIFDETIGHKLADSETQNWCGGTGKMMAFDVDGTIYPCLRYAPLSMSGRELLRIGDIKHGIGVLPKDKETVDMLNAITRQSQSTEECLSCPINSGCAWCSAYNYEVTGTPNKRVTYICPTHKARCMATSYFHNRVHVLNSDKERFPMNVPEEWGVPIIGGEEYAMLVALSTEPEKEASHI